jgi:hypothetical protein
MQKRKYRSALRNYIKHLFDRHLPFKQMYENNLAARLRRGKAGHAVTGQRQQC